MAWLPPSLSAGFLPFARASFSETHLPPPHPLSSSAYGPRAATLLVQDSICSCSSLPPRCSCRTDSPRPLFLVLGRAVPGFLDPVPLCWRARRCSGAKIAAARRRRARARIPGPPRSAPGPDLIGVAPPGFRFGVSRCAPTPPL